MPIDSAVTERLARLILPNLHRAYPTKPAYVLTSDADVRPPRELTPMFFGCFDWHSAVHSHWSLVRLIDAGGSAPWTEEARSALEQSFTAERAAGELAFLGASGRESFEMPYGIAWLLELDRALVGHPGWRATLAPLVELSARRFAAWLGRLPAPIRTGEHSQSAFAMGLALDRARAVGDSASAALIERRAREFHATDRHAPLEWEPSAHDFLSPALGVADLMARVLPAGELADWLDRFLPGGITLAPVDPVDRADGKLVHYDGLNFSRAWMLRNLATALPPPDLRRPRLRRLAEEHGAAGLRGLDTPHFAGTHWLPTFALYWLL
ncbi:MAG TPA: DUF2891 domain-containing protein [Kofleriaceae bacterium]|nr:DUF2891 domain-containing protein [Kofleriaceae bacterium]